MKEFEEFRDLSFWATDSHERKVEKLLSAILDSQLRQEAQLRNIENWGVAQSLEDGQPVYNRS